MTRRRLPGRSLTLANPPTFGALASPHRLETIAALGDAKSASIAELARRLGRSPHSLYYHIKRLADAGVVVPAETRRRGRRDEQVWTLAAERILLGPSPGAAGFGAAASKAVDSMLRLTSRELQAALRREERKQGARRTLIGLRAKGRVDGPTLERITRLVGRIEALIRKANQQERAGTLYAVTIVLTPTEDKARRED